MRLFLALAALCLALGLAVFHDPGFGASLAERTAEKAVVESLGVSDMQLPEMVTASAEESSAISERPLFHPSRRPRAPDAAPAERPSSAALPAMLLKGVMLTSRGRKALLAKGPAGPYVVVAEGDAIEGWTMKSIRKDCVILSAPEGDVTLALKSVATPDHEVPLRAAPEAPPKP